MRLNTRLACLLICSFGGVAWAQMPPPADDPMSTDPAPPPPPVATTTTATTPTPAPPPPAVVAHNDNGPLGSAFGVGVHAMLGLLSGAGGSIAGPVGPAIVYNGGRFHIEGILAYSDIDNGGSTLAVAGRGWFHVHESPGASLSVGGGLGFVNGSTDTGVGTTADYSVTVIEGGAQVRFFVTRNVALSASLGLTIFSGDADAFTLSGQLTGGLGVTYFIF